MPRPSRLPPASDSSAITLTALRHLAALADAGHFGRAAAACHVSQSALSEQIAKLEGLLGTPLVERGRGARLTDAGRAAVERARRILHEVDELADEAGAARAPLAGTFRLGVIPTLGPYLLPTLLPALAAAHPRLRLALHEGLTTALLQDVASHRLHAALVALPVALPGLVSRALFDEPFLALLPAGHALAARPSVRVDELRGERVLLLAEGHCLRDQALEFCGSAADGDAVGAGARPAAGARANASADAGVPANATPTLGHDLRATSLETLARLVAAGFGVTLVPALAAPRSPDLVVRPLVGNGRAPFVGRTLGLVWRKSLARPQDVFALAAILRATPAPAIPRSR